MPIASDFFKKFVRIVHEKMPDIYLSDFFQNLIIFITFGVTLSSNVANKMNHTVFIMIATLNNDYNDAKDIKTCIVNNFQ